MISIVFWLIHVLWSWTRRVLRKEQAGTCVVLLYHSVISSQQARFEKQMKSLTRLAKPISPDFRDTLENNIHHVIVTFDDGYANVVENALPILAKYKIPCVLFVTGNSFSSYPIWIEDCISYSFERIMTVDQLRSLNHNLVTVGSHTLTHPSLPEIPKDMARKEITESKKKLEKITGREIKLFSFPYGNYTSGLVQMAKEAGYERIFTVEPVLALRDPDGFIIGRCDVSPTDWFLEFRMKMMGAYRWLSYAIRLKRNLLYLLKGKHLSPNRRYKIVTKRHSKSVTERRLKRRLKLKY